MEMDENIKIDLNQLPELDDRYTLILKVGGGVGGEVFEGKDNETGK